MGFSGTLVKAILVFAVVLILMLVVFPMVWDVVAEVVQFFTGNKLKPVEADKVTIIGTDPKGVSIHAKDPNYWIGSNDEIDCIPCGNGCCLTVLFDRAMDPEDFKGEKLLRNVEVYEEKSIITDIGVPDVRGDWKTDPLQIGEYFAELKDGKKLVISGFKDEGDLNYLIRFNEKLMSFEKDSGKRMMINPDRLILTFEMS